MTMAFTIACSILCGFITSIVLSRSCKWIVLNKLMNNARQSECYSRYAYFIKTAKRRDVSINEVMRSLMEMSQYADDRKTSKEILDLVSSRLDMDKRFVDEVRNTIDETTASCA